MDARFVGEQAAKCMDWLNEDFEEDAEVTAVGMVVVVNSGGSTYEQTFTSCEEYYAQLGLFELAKEIIKTGSPASSDEGE